MSRLFIVEDEAIIAMDLAEQLEEFGYEVVGIAHDGESALEQLRELDPDLILMDIVLGRGIDGIETADQVLQFRSIPIIFLTAFSDPDTVGRAAKVAPYGYVTKPYNAQALRACIEVALTKHQLENKLLYKERWFSNILHAVHDGIIAVGTDGLIHFANPEACRLLEVGQVEALVGQDLNQLIQVYDETGSQVEVPPLVSAMQRNAVMPIVFNGSLKNKATGHRVFIDYSAAPVRGRANNVIGGLFAMRDASQRLRIESEIKKSDGRFQTAFNNSSVGVALVSLNGAVIEYNGAFKALIGLPDDGSGSITDLLSLPYHERLKIQDGHLALLSGQTSGFQHELSIQPPSLEDQRWLIMNITLLHDKACNPSYYFYQVYDQTDRKRAEQKLYHLANYDPLTGLLNLPQIKEELSHLFELNAPEACRFALITLDIDQFDLINDRFGHTVGDSLLAELASRLSDIGHHSFTVGRIGGDRFALVLHDLESVNQVMFMSNLALEEVREPFFLDDEQIELTACAGIALAPDDASSPDLLLEASGSALQLAKVNGRNQSLFYNESVAENIKGRVNNEVRITSAFESGKLSFHYLKSLAVSTDADRELIKVLLYWKAEECYLGADAFFNVTNNSGLARKLMIALVDTVCTNLIAKGGRTPLVIIPFFPSILRSGDLISNLAEKIRAYGLSPEDFIFGLTGHLMRDSRSLTAKIEQARQEGFKLCLNLLDGSRMTLDRLYSFSPEFCELEIDTSSTHEPYFEAILAMTQALNIPVIASNPTADLSAHHLKQLAYQLPASDESIFQANLVSE